MNLLLLLISLAFILFMVFVAWFINKKLGEQIRVVLDVLFYTRVSVITTFIGIAILAIAQGRDLAVGLADHYGRAVVFLLAVWLWAMQNWYFARKILDRIYGESRGVDRWEQTVVNAVPRILGVTAFLCAIAALWLVAENTAGYVYVATTIAMMVVFILLVVYRRKLQKRAARGNNIDFETLLFQIMRGLSVFILIVFTCWAFLSPVSMGFTLGAGATAFIVMASVVPVGTVMVYFTLKQRFPVVLSLLLIAAVFSAFNDNHAIRTLDTSPQRLTIDRAFDAWQQNNPGNEKQLVMVATAGGGIRAAYWTATVLGSIQDRYPEFRDKLFAISGVSGGTVGAAVFTSLLAQGPGLCDGNTDCYATDGQSVLSRDFLGPTVAAMLYPDFIQRLLPVAILPDRAVALETAWEQSWNRSLPDRQGTFGGAFTKQWNNLDKNWLPLLLSNSTHEETGARVITSPLLIERSVFADAFDFFNIVPCDIPTSTAALNSARFTYVSPAGRLNAGTCPHPAGQPGLNNTHLVDGGYFENYGASSARDLLTWLAGKAADENIRLKPVVIQISNDSGIPEKVLSDHYQPSVESNSVLNETLAPITTIFNTRGARGIMELINLYRWTLHTHNGEPACFFHFRFYSDPGNEPALGWVLSEKSQQWIRSHLLHQNHETYERLLKTLRSGECS